MMIRTVTLVAILVAGGVAAGQDTSTKDDNPELVKLRAVLDRSVEPFKVSPSGNPAVTMSSKPALRWTNNERDSESLGTVALWIDRGQPAVAMATYTWMGNIYHEFDLLARSPVIATKDGAVIWQPKMGLRFQQIPKAPVVEMTAPARLRQMKELSEQFAATMLGWRSDNSDKVELRRLPRELYRYKPEATDLIDGAVFAFVMGTDPEALLLIEAVKPKDQVEWQYAFVRQTSGALEARHNNVVVWSAEKHGMRNDPSAAGLSVPSRVNLKLELGK